LKRIECSTTLAPDEVRAHTLLYVDDDPHNLRAFMRVVGATFSVRTAISGAEALEILATERVSVLLTDQRMPGMSGIELCKIARRRHPKVHRALITGHPDRETAVAAINEGGVEVFLTKPWRRHMVLPVLHGLVERAHLDGQVEELQQGIIEQERLGMLALARGTVLHDLAGTTGGLMMSMYMMREEFSNLARRFGVEAIAPASDELNAMEELVGHIQLLHRKAHPDQMETQRELSEHEVKPLVALVLRLARRACEGIRIEVDVDPGLTFFGDRIDVSRILLNLIRNSAQALQSHVVDEPVIWLQAALDEGNVRIRVRDNGPGVPTELAGRIFELGSSSRIGRGGQGMGLFVCHQLATAGNGSVALEPGATGASFAVRLPVSREEWRRRIPDDDPAPRLEVVA